MAQPVTLRCGKPESETKEEMGLHRELQTTRLSMRPVSRKARADQERRGRTPFNPTAPGISLPFSPPE